MVTIFLPVEGFLSPLRQLRVQARRVRPACVNVWERRGGRTFRIGGQRSAGAKRRASSTGACAAAVSTVSAVGRTPGAALRHPRIRRADARDARSRRPAGERGRSRSAKRRSPRPRGSPVGGRRSGMLPTDAADRCRATVRGHRAVRAGSGPARPRSLPVPGGRRRAWWRTRADALRARHARAAVRRDTSQEREDRRSLPPAPPQRTGAARLLIFSAWCRMVGGGGPGVCGTHRAVA